MTLASDPSVLQTLRDKLRAEVADRGWSDAQIGEIELALDEAVSNIIRHGYQGAKQSPIEVEAEACRVAGHDGIEIRIRDYCENVDLNRICGRELDDVKPGGLGVHLIHAMMETVDYQHAEGGGVLLTMRKSKRHHARAKPADGDVS
jgi:anti-sigma regulatory factor (Ser/Thr protein kinase)